ncbi:uncharacterized protein O3C94_003492 [Discoglossus pictus]
MKFQRLMILSFSHEQVCLGKLPAKIHSNLGYYSHQYGMTSDKECPLSFLESLFYVCTLHQVCRTSGHVWIWPLSWDEAQKTIVAGGAFWQALEIKTVNLFLDEQNVAEPSRLLIPCKFTTDNPFAKSKGVLLEWKMRPSRTGNFTTILKIYDTVLENVKSPNTRAQVFVSLIPNGNCSLLINPTTVNDSGMYEVHVTIQGKPFIHVPRIKIWVTHSGEKVIHHQREVSTPPAEEGSNASEAGSKGDIFAMRLHSSQDLEFADGEILLWYHLKNY